jgi:16S rRNA (cytosine967-C5)-methyltransferase
MTTVHLGCSPEDALRIRDLAVHAYDEARNREWPFLSDVLDGAARSGTEEDRAVLAATVQALVKYDRLLAFACGSSLSQARFESLVALARGETKLEARLARIDDATERLGTTYSLPNWIVDLVRSELGHKALEPALARMNEPAPRVARVNTLRTTRPTCITTLAAEGLGARETTHAAQGLLLDGRRSLFRTQAFAQGALESQDEASQLVAELVAPPPKSFAIDACAGAGGKTLALSALLAGKGKLLALDVSPSKVEELRRRARRAGASNVEARVVDLLEPGDALTELRGRASRVLVDAPCTGLGAIRRNPEARWRLLPDDLARLVLSQAALCKAAAALVAPHGRLVYATCSFLPSEGETGIEFFLSERPDFSLVTVRDVLGRKRTERVVTADGKYLSTWRFDGTADGGDEGMDGFFAAVARRASRPSGDAGVSQTKDTS